MTFSLRQASTPHHPRPVASAVRQSMRRSLPRRFVVAALTAFLGGAFAFWVTFHIGIAGDIPGITGKADTVIRAASAVAGICVALFVMVFENRAVTECLVYSTGYAVTGAQTVSGHHPLPPGGLKRAALCVRLLAFAVGGTLGTSVSVLWAAPPLPEALLIVAAAVAVDVLVARFALPRLRAAREQWRTDQQRLARIDAIRSHGVHTTATVQEARFLRSWLDDQPVFALTLRTSGPEVRTFSIRYADYPRWAPQQGDEFDMWTDGAVSDAGADEVVLERRHALSRPAGDVKHLRRPSGGSDGPDTGPYEPTWATAIERNTSRARILYLVSCVLAGLATLATLALSLIAWVLFGPSRWWLVLLLAVGCFSALVMTWRLIQIRIRPRRAVSAGAPLGMPGLVAAFAAFAGLFGIVFSWAFVFADELALGPEGALVGIAAMLCLFSAAVGFIIELGTAGFVTPVALTAMRRAARAPAAPVDLVHRALHSGEPAAARLEHNYGIVVGAAMLR